VQPPGPHGDHIPVTEEAHRPQTQRAALPRCQRCGEIIGVYEPLVVGGASSWRTTSLAAEPELEDADVSRLHLACAETQATAEEAGVSR
jgi:hypothetical protein